MIHTPEEQKAILDDLKLMQALYQKQYMHGNNAIVGIGEKYIQLENEFFLEVAPAPAIEDSECDEFGYITKSVVIDGVKYISLFDKPIKKEKE
jgi:hypothetical protein